MPASNPTSLTESQRRAVEHAGGPLAVLAGPGTGKTRVIIERVAHMVLSREIDPSRILAVTFTVKAAREMRQRLAERLSGNRADLVRVSTSHAFGREIVTRFADVLGFPGPPRLIDSAVVRRTLREVGREIGAFASLPGSSRDATIGAAGRFIGDCRNAGVTAARAAAFASDWLRGLEARRDTGGDSQELAAELATAGRFAEHARLFGAFEAATHARGWITTDELITLPTRLLREREGIGAIVRQDTRHVLFDEFQDANPAQIELLRALCPPRSGEGPDLCVVGDDDQSIYRFRGADDRGFVAFEAIWGGVTRVKLEENYRSRGPVIAASRAIIDAALHRYDATKRARVAEAKPEHAAGPSVELVAIPHARWSVDAALIAAMILDDQRRAEAAGRVPTPARRTAVIARTKADAARIATGLEVEGIPCRLHARGGLLDDPSVRDIADWIAVLCEPSAVWEVYRVLCRPPVGLGGAEASALRAAYDGWTARRAYQAGSATRDVASLVAFLRTIGESDGAGGDAGGDDTISPATAAAVGRFLRLYGALASDTAGVAADRAAFDIIAMVGTPESELLAPDERAARVRRLAAFMSFVKNRLPMLATPGDLRALHEYLGDLEDTDDGVSPDEQVDRVEDEGGDEAEAVQVLTAHASKGLEFDTVYVPRVGNYGYCPKSKDRPDGLPAALVARAGIDTVPEHERQEAEERRVFYVACTRAERRLVVLCPVPGADSLEDSRPATYFRDLRGVGEPAVVIRTPEDILRGAAESGALTLASRGSTDGGGLALAEHAGSNLTRRTRRRVLMSQARRAARAMAAAALERADDPALDAATLAGLNTALARAARMLSIIAGIEHAAGPAEARLEAVLRPEDDAELRAMAGRIASAHAAAEETRDFESMLVRAPAPPLRLSQSAIHDYQTCPRCYYLKHVLKFPEPDTAEVRLGAVVHKALERFYTRVRDADGGGERPPGREELLAVGRRAYDDAVAAGGRPDAVMLADVQAALACVYDRLHNDADHVIEIERYAEFPYEHGGVVHTMSAKIDRIDLRGDGGYRIIDYKTGGVNERGEASKAYLEPKATDLQLGIYAMALPFVLGARAAGAGGENGGAIEMPRGEAQYWLTGTGQRGVIGFERMKLAGVRKAIGGVIDGILGGEFAPDPSCARLCRTLGLGWTPADAGV